MTSAGKRFTVFQRFLHWLMAICVLAMLFVGVGMNSTVAPKFAPLLATHKTLGVIVLVLALIRLAVRLRSGAPPLPADLPEPMKLGAYLLHFRTPDILPSNSRLKSSSGIRITRMPANA